MTKEQALHSFWNSFALTAYEENSVPTGENKPSFPYITYSVTTDTLGSNVALSGNLWYRGTSWARANAKAEEISKKIGKGGVMVACDGGAVWITRGTPFVQNLSDPSDDMCSSVKKKSNLNSPKSTSN